jgi:membrane-associated PAP2 superfamily phosphatase
MMWQLKHIANDILLQLVTISKEIDNVILCHFFWLNQLNHKIVEMVSIMVLIYPFKCITNKNCRQINMLSYLFHMIFLTTDIAIIHFQTLSSVLFARRGLWGKYLCMVNICTCASDFKNDHKSRPYPGKFRVSWRETVS